MDDLKQLIRDMGGITQVARMAGVKPPTVSGWKQIPSDHAAAIEAALQGRVTRRQMRPHDWWRIWPELVTEDFPAPESSQEAA